LTVDPTTAGLIAIGLCVVLILTEMPVALAVGGSGTVGIILLSGTQDAASTLGTVPFSATAKYALFAIPAYVLLGCVISNAGIGTQIYRVVNKGVRRLPGGLAATAVLATAIFSGISGSSAADVATFGRVSVTEMGRNGYNRPYAASVVAAAGTFAVLIPPSITLVIYAIVAQVSVGAMILAGVVPGIISCLILAAFVVCRAAVGRKPGVGGAASATVAIEADAIGKRRDAVTETAAAGTVRGPAYPDNVAAPGHGIAADAVEVLPEDVAVDNGASDVLAILSALVLFAVVIGGLYAGIFTATEAGAVGTFVAVLIAAFVVRGRLSIGRLLWESLIETAEISAMIFMLLVGGAIFTFALALSQVPFEVSAWAGGLSLSPKIVVGIILLMLIPLGAFLDGLSVLLLTVPIIAPIATDMGFNEIWFGILVLKVVEVGLITPPVGINAFIIAGITKTPVDAVYRSLLPFVILDIAVTGIFFMLPDLVLWLPRVAGLL
jgi:C4-dicarboxylate transporter DctM subunit